MRGGYGIERVALALALAVLGGCATAGGGSRPNTEAAPAPGSDAVAVTPGHWRRLQDSIAAQAIAEQRGPRVTIRASYSGFGGLRQVRGSFRMRDDAYVLVAHVDADGRLTVLFPKNPQDDGYVEGGRSYSIPEFDAGFQSSYAFARFGSNMRYRPYSSRLASYDGGTGYLFVVASWRPMQFDRIVENGRWANYELTDAYSSVDPRDAVDEFAGLLAGDGREAYSVEYATYFRSNYTMPGYASFGFRNEYCDQGYSGFFGSPFGNYWGLLVPAGAGWFYVPISDPFSGCTSYHLAYLGAPQTPVVWVPRDTSTGKTSERWMRPTGPRDAPTRVISARELKPMDAFTPQPDYRSRGLITAQDGAGQPKGPDLSGRRGTPSLKLGDPRPNVTEMVMRSRDRGDAPAVPQRPHDVGRGRGSPPAELPVVSSPAAVGRGPRTAPGYSAPRSAPRSAPTHSEPRASTPRMTQPASAPSSGNPAATAPASSSPRESSAPSSPRAAPDRPKP